MKYLKLNIKLVKFVVTVIVIFSLPLIAVSQVVRYTTTIPARQSTASSESSLPKNSNAPALPAGGGDWPMYLHDPQRTSSTEQTLLSPANAAKLTQVWSFKTGGMVASSAAEVGGVVYFGSWDGYEYALDEATGALKWKTYLGKTVSDARCYPLIIGVTSSAAVQNGVVYVGGGDTYWYALNAASGAVLWKVYIGDNSIPGGNYNWSSPLLYNGYAYIGVSSNCDVPLIPGKLIQVNLQTHQIAHTLVTTPPEIVGAGIWTSPSIDPATNTIYLATGTASVAFQYQPLAQAVVAVDASTLTVKASWRVPDAETVSDSDFSTTPILFTDENGTPMVAAINKNGYLYTFNRNNVGDGPVWQQQIAIPGVCTLCGAGSISSSTFGQGILYVGGGFANIGGLNYQGSVDALDPATGKFLWRHGTAGPIFGALTYTNGLIIEGAGPFVEVLDAATGTRLYSYQTGNQIYSAPSVSRGRIFIGSTDGSIYAFGLPTGPLPSPANDAHCPRTWNCQDIGNPIVPGSETYTQGAWSIKAAGTGITGTNDQLHFISQEISGNVQMSTQIVSQTESGISAPAQTGLMIRQRMDAGSPYYAIFYTAGLGIVAQYRSSFNGETTTDVQMPGASLPLYVEIQRNGDQFQAATSKDGSHYTLLPGSSARIVMPVAAAAGMALSSDSSVTLNTATYSAVTIEPLKAPLTTSPSLHCPSGWSCSDVGNPGITGNQSLKGGTWTLQGSGLLTVPGTADQFHYVWQPLIGNGSMSVCVASQTLTPYHAEAGIMIRQSTDPASAYYAAYASPFDGATVEDRSYTGLPNELDSGVDSTDPVYLKVVRSGDTFSAYISYDGVNWALIAGSTITINMGTRVLIGLVATSQDTHSASTATFTTLKLA